MTKKFTFLQLFSLIEKIKEKYNEEIEVPQLKDEFNTSDFVQYMIDNSLILK